MLIEELNKKWQPVLEHPELDAIKDSQKKHVVAQLLENTQNALREGSAWSPGGFLSETPMNDIGNPNP